MKIIKALIFFFLQNSAFHFPVNAQLIESTHIADISQIIEEAGQKEILILFDIDDTLIDSAILLSSGPWIDFYWQVMPKSIPNKLSTIQDLMWTISYHIPIQAVEPTSSSFICSLQQLQTTKSIALTARPLYNRLINGAALTSRQLLSVGIDFSQTKAPASFSKHPLFCDGIVYNAGKMKGEFLRNFLIDCDYFPDKVIFIDDKIEQINSVEKVMKELGIPVDCIWYRRASLERPLFDLQIANIQLEYLIKYQVILSDKEAALLKKSYQTIHPERFLIELIELFETKS